MEKRHGQHLPTSNLEQTKRFMPWLVAVAMFMENLDATIVNTAVPTMAASLEVTRSVSRGC